MTATTTGEGPTPDPDDPASRRCGSCRWHGVEGFYLYHGAEADGMGDVGLCRRRPPLPDLTRYLSAPKGATTDQAFVWAVWPETQEDEWCGEWAAAERREEGER